MEAVSSCKPPAGTEADFRNGLLDKGDLVASGALTLAGFLGGATGTPPGGSNLAME